MARKREESIPSVLSRELRGSVKRLILPFRIVAETTIIYVLFLLGDFLVLGATRLVFNPETPFMINLRTGLEVLSAIGVAISYLIHVISSFMHQMQLSKIEDQPKVTAPTADIRQLEDEYRRQLVLVEEVLQRLRRSR